MRGELRTGAAERRWLMVALTCALGVAPLPGCASRGRAGEAAPQAREGSVEVTVRNDNPQDMDVYVVSEGVATRLGTVTTGATAHFALDPSFFPSDQIRIVATPIGGNGRASSGPLVVQPGQHVDFTIAPLLRASSASVR